MLDEKLSLYLILSSSYYVEIDINDKLTILTSVKSLRFVFSGASNADTSSREFYKLLDRSH